MHNMLQYTGVLGCMVVWVGINSQIYECLRLVLNVFCCGGRVFFDIYVGYKHLSPTKQTT